MISSLQDRWSVHGPDFIDYDRDEIEQSESDFIDIGGPDQVQEPDPIWERQFTEAPDPIEERDVNDKPIPIDEMDLTEMRDPLNESDPIDGSDRVENSDCIGGATQEGTVAESHPQFESVAEADSASLDETLPAGGHTSFNYGGGRFESTARGLRFVPPKEGSNQARPVWLCSPLRVIAKTRDVSSEDWGRLLEWADDDGVTHQWAMPLELLEGDKSEVRKMLARKGLQIDTSTRSHGLLAAYLKTCPVKARVRCVDRLGWHDTLYALPMGTVGRGEETLVFQNAHAIEPAFGSSGSVESWRDSVGRFASGNSRLVFAISVAFAGVLAYLAGEESGGFHLRGKSSSGKSTALRAAASVWGPPDRYIRHWRATTNGLEGLAALHNDNMLVVDEISQCDPREVGEAAYLLANGQGKARANRTGAARAPQQWRLMFLSAGEESLSALMAKAGKRANVGQEVRLADIGADAGAGMGIVEDLHGFHEPADLIHAIKTAAEQNHGEVGKALLEAVVANQSELKVIIPKRVAEFVKEVLPIATSGQAERVARRFALVAFAGEVATGLSLTGWEPGEADRAAKACFSAWLDSFGGDGNREERRVLEHIAALFEAHGNSRFEDCASGEQHRVLHRLGFRKTDGAGGIQYLVLPEAFKKEFCDGMNPKDVEKLLVAKGWIEPGGDGRATQKLRLPGVLTPTRVYVFSSRMWEAEE